MSGDHIKIQTRTSHTHLCEECEKLYMCEVRGKTEECKPPYVCPRCREDDTQR